MIKRLQIKIIAVILGTLLLVFAAVFFALNLSVYQTSVKRADDFMTLILENDGVPFPAIDAPGALPGASAGALPDRNSRPRPFPSMDMMRGGRFFYVKVDNNGSIIEDNMLFMFGFGQDDALGFVESAIAGGRVRGNIGSYSYKGADKSYGRMIVFVERSIDILLIERLNEITLWAAAIVCLVLLCLSIFIAKWVAAPVKNSFDKQRRFISDASHELKTPLTIISANLDVLENEIGENRRLSQIKSQSKRMNELVLDLLTLAKTDEGHENIVRGRFNLSGAVLNTALEFESRAFEEKKEYSYDILENLEYFGDERQVKQLVTILVDNAIRYSGENGVVEVSLQLEGGRNRISVYNTGIGVPDDEREKIFERFYRTDESRSRETGGCGVGLSIAKSIVEAHKGRISVTGEYNAWIRFDVIL